MHSNRGKHIRFDQCSSDMSFSFEMLKNRSFFTLKKPKLLKGIEERMKQVWKLSNSVVDPQGPFVQKCNKVFLLSCVIAVAVDPLFFYTPVIEAKRMCISLDKKLAIVVCALRTIVDLFYMCHILLMFRTGFIASREFGRGELIEDPKAIAKQYIRSYLLFDVLSILPLPQAAILVRCNTRVMKELLKIIIFCQYVPRLLRIIPLFNEVTSTSGIVTETAWAGAALNLFIYMLSSHVIGAFWYLFAIERKDKCWRIACQEHESECHLEYLYCGGNERKMWFLNNTCPLLKQEEINSEEAFDFGIFLDAHKSRATEHTRFLKKFFYCFWWGLRNLSSLGQNLNTSNFIGENLFAVFISIIGLVLFSLLIGNMQKYLQSITVRIEEMRLKRRDAEQWMSHRMLPERLRQRIKRYQQYKWQETRGVEEESLIGNLPKDLRRDIKRHLCWTLVKRVPMFQNMDQQLQDAVCSHLKPVLYTENSSIINEGDPVDEILFIMRGTICTSTTNGGQTGFYNSAYLKPGDFCGEELLTWALETTIASRLPISTRTVTAVKDVEAFSITADDLKLVASQFRRLHSKQLRRTFRFYSQQWRTWAARTIQVAWHRHCRRKLYKSLRQAQRANEGHTLSSLAYASRFATNMLHNHQPRVPSLPLQKPAEPDFLDS